jgi:4'-phosphopantetheinyl transferase EntD
VIETLFPTGVCVATGSSEGDEPLHPEEVALARGMGAARRREFAAGRACAHRAIAALGADDGPVLRGLRRAPRFPDGLVGAITHTHGYCAAAVAHAAAFAGVGLDAERDAPLSSRAVARICGESELAALAALPGRTREHWGAVLFSAKETLYKAYFPITGVFIGFRDAEIALAPESATAGRFSARLVRADAPDAVGRREFAGRYASDGERVVTGLVIPARY